MCLQNYLLTSVKIFYNFSTYILGFYTQLDTVSGNCITNPTIFILFYIQWC